MGFNVDSFNEYRSHASGFWLAAGMHLLRDVSIPSDSDGGL